MNMRITARVKLIEPYITEVSMKTGIWCAKCKKLTVDKMNRCGLAVRRYAGK